MTPSTVRVGVVGAGSIAGLHLAAYAKNPDVTVAAICDLNVDRAGERAAQFGAPAVFSDYRELVTSPDVDVVSVCTRNDTHAEVAIAALEAGKSVLIEKPMAMNVAQAEAIVEAEANNVGFAQVGYVRRFSSNAVTLKSFIDAGDLGALYYAKATLLRQAGNPGGWFSDRSIAGGGPLIDLGVHFIDMCLFLMDFPEVQSVSGFTFESLGNRRNILGINRQYMTADYDETNNSVEDLAGALVRFTSGAVLMMDTSYSLHGRNKEFLEVYGEKGGATLEPALSITTELHDTIVEVAPTIDSLSFDLESSFQNEIDTFVRTAQGAIEPVAPATHGLNMARIIDAIYESAERGAEVRLTPLPDPGQVT